MQAKAELLSQILNVSLKYTEITRKQSGAT
jgi:hypothetical protein